MQDRRQTNRENDPRRKRSRYRSYIIRAMVNGEMFEVADISVTGVFITQTPDWFAEGQGILFDFVIGHPPDEKVIPIEGRITRINDNGIGVIYRPPSTNWPSILQKITSREV